MYIYNHRNFNQQLVSEIWVDRWNNENYKISLHFRIISFAKVNVKRPSLFIYIALIFCIYGQWWVSGKQFVWLDACHAILILWVTAGIPWIVLHKSYKSKSSRKHVNHYRAITTGTLIKFPKCSTKQRAFSTWIASCSRN